MPVSEDVIGFQSAPPSNALQEWLDLANEKKRIKDRLDELESRTGRMAELERQLLNEWADRGIQKVSLNGQTVYLRNDFYCGKRPDVPTNAVCEALKLTGFAGLVSEGYNAQSLKARVKELVETDQVPEELKACLNYDTVTRLVAVKG